MPHGRGADLSADSAAVENTVSSINIAIEVKLIGVVGCSASGKSTVAHHVASRLDSPLHPISTDNFFVDDVCVHLGTYDDYRCIDYDAVTRWMSVLLHAVPMMSMNLLEERGAPALSPATRASSVDDSGGTGRLPHDFEERVQEAWWARMRLQLPELDRYRRVAPDVTSATVSSPSAVGAAAVTAAQPSSTVTEASCAGGHANDGPSDDDSDASLCAHEAEEEGRRRRRVAAPTHTKGGVASTCDFSLHPWSGTDEQALHTVAPFSHYITIYVVWEGITLLCNRLVNSYIDYVIDVQCDLETACLRRFFRTPRRHLSRYVTHASAEGCGNGPQGESKLGQQCARAAVVAGVVRQVYRPRIEQVWSVRSREHYRIDIMTALELEMQLDGLETLVQADSCVATSCPACITAHDALDLLSPFCFNPPRPHCMRKLADADAAKAMSDGGNGTSLQGEGCEADLTPFTISDASASSATVAERVGNNCSACWSVDGLPTDAFQFFWEREFDDWLAHQQPSAASTAADGAALAWASLMNSSKEGLAAYAAHRADKQQHDVNDGCSAVSPSPLTLPVEETGVAYVNQMLMHYGRLALLQSLFRDGRVDAPSSPGAPHVGGKGAAADDLGPALQLAMCRDHHTAAVPAQTLSSALAPFYYEFRYWFFFEVLYYDRLFRPLQAHRLRWRSVVGDSGAASADEDCGRSGKSGNCGATCPPCAVPRLWWVLRNGRDVQGQSADELLTQVDHICAAIRAAR
uniref:Phosphoribulokinase/uridine kinase domain-containing protein n=1 Tax=Leishmania guyanensis TaxID=5670 RepID=A0A1E1IV91_LEIGU|nr:hypothetical protein, conserved [Leishmania guyanensis]